MDSPQQSAAVESAAATEPPRRNPGLFYFGLVTLILAIIALVVVAARSLTDKEGRPLFRSAVATATATPADPSPATTSASPTPRPATAQPSGTNTPAVGVTVVQCGDILAPVDKQHALPSDCAPGDLQPIPGEFSANGQQFLRSAAASALVDMFQAAARDGHRIFANSGYRS